MPSTIIKYGYTEEVKNAKRNRVKKIGKGDQSTELAIEYIENVESKYIVVGRECTILKIYNIDSMYYPASWIVRGENTTSAIKNVILPYAQKLINYLGDQAPERIVLNFCFNKNGEKFPQIEIEVKTAAIQDYSTGKITAKKLVEDYPFYHTLERQRHYPINKINE